MANFLTTLLQGLAGVSPQDNEVEGITVMPPKRPVPPPAPPPNPAQNPFTADYIAAAQAAALNGGQLPRVSGGTNAGLFGFLPQGVQHGRLRDILGAVGDGLLMSGGMDPIYQPRVDQRRMGQALLGYGQDPNAAIERLGLTGSPESIKTAGALRGDLQTADTAKASREATALYRENMDQFRRDQILQRASTIVPGIVARAKTPEEYESAYNRLDEVARRIDPESDPTTAWGLPHPDDWEPGMTAWVGTTGGQQIGADVNRERIAQSDVNNRRTTSTSSANNQRSAAVSAANNRRSTATSAANNQRTVAQSDVNSRRSAGSKTGGTGLHPRNGGGGGNPVVKNRDVSLLRSNDTAANRAAFDKHFGSGAAKRYLGK